MKKLLIGFIGLAALLVGVALIAPSFINWNDYRAEIATEVHKATGRKLTIDGNIDVALLPAPKLSVAKVRLANLDGARDADMMRLDTLDVRIAFWPLLSGKIVVSSISLRGADIALEALADGRKNWQFAPGAAAPATGTGGADSGNDVARAVRLEQVIVSGGRVSYRDSRGGTVERIDGIDARLAAETLKGPFVLRGRAVLRGVAMQVEARAGRLDAAKPAPVSGEVRLSDAAASAKFTGTVATGATPGANLRFDAAGDSLARAMAALSGGSPGPALLERKFTLSGAVAGDARAVAVNDIVLAINGTRVTGALNASLGTVTSVDATIGANTIDLDSWMAAAANSSSGARNATPGKGKTSAPFALPDNIRLAFDARIGGITFKKAAIREVQLQARMDRGVLTLTRLGAMLPGGSELSANGRLSARAGVPRFDGQLTAKAADLRALFDWLGVDHSAIAPDRLRRASLRAGLGAGPERLELRDMDLRFDSTRIGGGIVLALRDRIGLGANLVVDHINLDAYRAKSKAAAKSPAAGGGGAKGGGLAALAAFDANVRAEAGSLTVGNMTLGRVNLEGSLIGGTLTLKQMRVGDFAGGQLDLSGTVAALDKTPVPDLRFALTTRAPDKLLALAGVDLPVSPAALTPFAFSGRLKSEAATTRIESKLAAGALRVALNGALKDLDRVPRVGLDVGVDHPDFIRFVRLFAPGFVPQKPVTGPFSLTARAESAGLDVKLTSLAGRFGEAEVAGTATLALAAVRPKLVAELTGKNITADHFIPGGRASGGGGTKGGVPAPGVTPWSDAPLELSGMRALDADIRIGADTLNWRVWKVAAPRIELALNDGRLEVKRVSGKTVGGTFLLSGALAAPAKRGGAAEFTADVDISRADLSRAMFNAAALDIAKGTLSYDMKLAGRGASSRALVSSLTGGGKLVAVDGAVSGFDLRRVNDQLRNLSQPTSFLALLQTAMAGGTTQFSKLAGTFKVEKGVVRSDDITLAADGGTGVATLAADLPRWRLDAGALFRLAGHRDAPPFRMTLRGPLDNPARVFNLNELQQWLVARSAGALLNQLLGGKKKAQPAQTGPAQVQPSQPSQPKPEEFIRGIFDLLQKKK
jgi:uncharacterized protein involved in outer membrane biogenesis